MWRLANPVEDIRRPGHLLPNILRPTLQPFQPIPTSNTILFRRPKAHTLLGGSAYQYRMSRLFDIAPSISIRRAHLMASLEQAIYNAHTHKETIQSAIKRIIPDWKHIPYLARNLHTNYVRKLATFPHTHTNHQKKSTTSTSTL